MNKFAKALGFDPVAKQTTVRKEIVAGVVTFLAMAYILMVNPLQILGDNVDLAHLWPSVFMATAFGAVIGTLLMAFLAKMPLAQASGMGLNSALGMVVGGAYGFAFSIGQGFMMVLISGVVFLIVSLLKIKGKSLRELIFDGMPVAIKGAISVGIGLFIAYIGFQNAKIIVGSPYTISDLVIFSNYDVAVANAAVCLVGLFTIVILEKFNVKGAVIIGILAATIVGIPLNLTDLSVLSNGEGWKFWENYKNFFSAGEGSVFGSFTNVFSEGFPAGSAFTVIMLVVTFCMIDMFDTMGTIVGCCGGNRILSDENNKPYNYNKIMISDSIATCAGAMLGTSTVTTFVESGAGVSAGGRTGLTAFTTACLFFLATFILPVFQVIPGAATASALIYVGVLMMKNNVKNIDFSDAINATSAFLTIIIMVLGYSITDGIGIGIVSYTLMHLVSYGVNWIVYAINKKEKPKFEVTVVSIVIAVLFLVYFLVPAVL